ncbi:MAG: anti-sigma factor family protein [Solirubrobacteraceae bacterium]
MHRLLDRLRFILEHRWVPRHASEYLDGELGPDQRRRVERHTEACPECRELVRGLRALIAALGTIREDEPRAVAAVVLASIQGRLADLPQDGP